MELEITGHDLTIETLVGAARAGRATYTLQRGYTKGMCRRDASLSSKLQKKVGQCMGFL